MAATLVVKCSVAKMQTEKRILQAIFFCQQARSNSRWKASRTIVIENSSSVTTAVMHAMKLSFIFLENVLLYNTKVTLWRDVVGCAKINVFIGVRVNSVCRLSTQNVWSIVNDCAHNAWLCPYTCMDSLNKCFPTFVTLSCILNVHVLLCNPIPHPGMQVQL